MRWRYRIKQAAALLVIAGIFAACTANPTIPPAAEATAPADAALAAGDQTRLMHTLYTETARSVVGVQAVRTTVDGSIASRVNGSGFVIDSQGGILTTAHVALDANALYVQFEDGSIAEAALAGADTFSDLALLRVNLPADRLTPLRFGSSDALQVGQPVLLVANPYGVGSVLLSGMISALGRQLPSAQLMDAGAPAGFQNPSIIQLDAPVTPGSSGAPLLNLRGEVVGVNTALGGTGEPAGMGFVIPARTVHRVVPELRERGTVDYAYIGISTLPEENGFTVAGLAGALGLPVNSGVLVTWVTPGGPADAAGVRGGTTPVRVRGVDVCAGGDVIAAINGQYVETMSAFLTYLVTETHPGDTVTLLVVRDDSTQELAVTLASRPTSGENSVPSCGE